MRHPYYIVAPPFDEKSAGNRVLYSLASALRRLGEESYVTIHEQWNEVWSPVPHRYDVVPLTASLARQHREAGRSPICIYPEVTYRVPEAGFNVLYLLNFADTMHDGAGLLDYDYIISYSAAIARRAAQSDMVVHIPVSDPDYWSPAPGVRRDRAAVYAGKYVDVHRQTIPADLAGARVIQRHGLGAPTRAELREIFRSSTHLYVFESTALAAEAVLCGCPVVYQTNPFFGEHVGENELSLAGFTTSDRPDALKEAAFATAAFRSNYLSVMAGVDAAIHAFIVDSQARAAAIGSDRPFPVRPFVGTPDDLDDSSRSDIDPMEHRPEDRDIRFAYWLFLCREPETMAAIRGKRGLSPARLAGVFLDSEEFAERIVDPVRRGVGVDVPAISRKAMADLQQWIDAILPIISPIQARLDTSASWYALLFLVLSDARFCRTVISERRDWRKSEFQGALERLVARDRRQEAAR